MEDWPVIFFGRKISEMGWILLVEHSKDVNSNNKNYG